MGRPFVYRVIFISACLNLFMLVSLRYLWGQSLLDFLESREWQWLASGIEMLMSNGWRVFLASFLAILFAESADTEIFQFYRDRSWIVRVIRSNTVSIPADSILFNLIAFAGSAYFPPIILAKVILGEIVAKFVVGALYAVLYPRPKEYRQPSDSAG
jgi:uncharacterized PurR-regulated membrane protein YhhQ (DUF165 family)